MRSTLPIVLLVAAAGCAHARKEAPVSTAAPTQREPVAPAVAEPDRSATPPVACRTDDQCSANELCVEARCVAIDASTTACNEVSTHFDFDRAIVRENDFPTLRRAARCLQAQPDANVRIEGNCDDRGTTAYNLVLGQRRAAADQEYLVNLGVASSRISTVSYGKERPRCGDATESCRAQNRRGDLAKTE